MTRLASRRNVLKGALGGAAVTVGLPFLDCFLNTNGTALAATGKELPVCFGTWYQGLGFDPGQWIPEKVGTGYTNKHQLRMFEPLKHKINIISGTKYFMDGRPLETHTSGYQISSTGSLRGGVVYGASLDQIIADQIGRTNAASERARKTLDIYLGKIAAPLMLPIIETTTAIIG